MDATALAQRDAATPRRAQVRRVQIRLSEGGRAPPKPWAAHGAPQLDGAAGAELLRLRPLLLHPLFYDAVFFTPLHQILSEG